MLFKESNLSLKDIIAYLKNYFHTKYEKMPLFSVNMAVPIKKTVGESQIYFLSSAENVPRESNIIDKKYLIFKTFELVSIILLLDIVHRNCLKIAGMYPLNFKLVTALCALMLFAFGMRNTENEIAEMIKYITLGVVTIYPLLFILLSINITQRPFFSILSNILATVSLFAIGGTTISTSWHNTQHLVASEREKYSDSLMQIRSSFLLIFDGFLYFIESFIMSIELGKTYFNNN